MVRSVTNVPNQQFHDQSSKLRSLEARVARLEQYLETQHTITRIIASNSNLKTALLDVLRAICETTGWDFGEVWYVNRQDNRLYCESTWLRPSLQLPSFEHSGQTITFQPGKGLPGRVWASGKPAWIPNVVLDDNFLRSMIAEQDGLRAGIAIPIRTEGEIIGALAFFSRHRRPIDRELLQTLDTAGNQIGLYIERKRSEKEEREREWTLAALEERQRLARDLHDSVTQTLFSASVMAEMLPILWHTNPDQVEPGLHEVHQLTQEALKEMRTMLSTMRSTTPECSNLTIVLSKLAEKLMQRTNMMVNLDVDLAITLPDNVQMTLYRITQESLNNIAKHANADQVWIRLYIDMDHTIILSIEDNGQGFDMSSVSADHFGIAIMQERAESIGSTLHISSHSEKGTCIKIKAPLIA